MRNVNELLKEAKWGQLSQEEIDYVVHRIKASTPENEDADLSMLIAILGACCAIQYRELVEKFLHYPSSPLIAQTALETLCDEWGYTLDYIKEIKQFIDGVEWDKKDDLRMAAIACAPNILTRETDNELLQILFNIFENGEERQKDSIKRIKTNVPILRRCAYEAIVLSMGVNYADMAGLSNIDVKTREKELDQAFDKASVVVNDLKKDKNAGTEEAYKTKKKVRTIDDLKYEAEWGKLSDEEINSIVKRIEVSTPDNEDPDLYDLIEILGLADLINYKGLLEKFLYYPSSSWISNAALEVLCKNWGYTLEYRKEIREFLKPMEWDKHSYLRSSAFFLAPEILKKTQDKELLQLLLDIFDNDRQNDAYIRMRAYQAIALGMGVDLYALLKEPGLEELIKTGKLDLSVIDKARDMLKAWSQVTKKYIVKRISSI